jgi:hypothetical protein
MSGRFGKYGDAKRKLNIRKTRRYAVADLHDTKRKRPAKQVKVRRRPHLSAIT